MCPARGKGACPARGSRPDGGGVSMPGNSPGLAKARSCMSFWTFSCALLTVIASSALLVPAMTNHTLSSVLHYSMYFVKSFYNLSAEQNIAVKALSANAAENWHCLMFACES